MSEIYFLGSDNMCEPIFIEQYSDETPRVKTLGWERIVRKAHTVVVRHTSLNDFVTAMFLVDAVNAARPLGEPLKKLVLPYVPGARQDRSNPTGDVLFVARSVARMINARRFNRVVILDPHSPVIVQEIERVSVYPIVSVYDKLDNRYDGVIAPDKGAMNRAMLAGHALGVESLYASKTRDVSNGKITGFSVPSLKLGGHYLVVDDICDGGGTFIGLGEKIREQGATADLYVTHGLFAKGTWDLYKIYNNIYTTDSLNQNDNDVDVLAVVKDMENY